MPYPSYVSRPKGSTDKKDRISIAGVDYSNAFRSFGVTSTKSTETAGGFNPTGIEETVPGAITQTFTGEMYCLDDVVADFWDWHINDTVVEIQWQKNGLVDASAPVFYGNMTINETSPQSTFGTVTTAPFSAIPADSDGIQRADGT